MTCLSQGSMNIFPSVYLFYHNESPTVGQLAREARKTKESKIDGSFNYELVFWSEMAFLPGYKGEYFILKESRSLKMPKWDI